MSYPQQKQARGNQVAFQWQEHQENYLNTQNYVTTLFGSLPRVQLYPTEFARFGSIEGSQLIKKLLVQNQSYGKKIIQLSEKFTQLYRKDHFFDRKDFQQKIVRIHSLVVGPAKNNLQQSGIPKDLPTMIEETLKKLDSPSFLDLQQKYQQLKIQHQLLKTSTNQKFLSPPLAKSIAIEENINDSRLKKEIRPGTAKENLHLSNLSPNEQQYPPIESSKVSRKQSMQSKGSFQGKQSQSRSGTKKKTKNMSDGEEVSLKKFLRLEGFLEEEEQAIRQIFNQLNSKMDDLKISKHNFSPEKLSYCRLEDEKSINNLESFLEAACTNHKTNLTNISSLLGVIFGDFDRKIFQEMQSQQRFALYTKQIQKREEVYSYAVSKLLGQVQSLRNSLSIGSYQQCNQIVEGLVSIGQKFYELYPSNSVIKDLKVRPQKKEFQIRESKNYGVQVVNNKVQKHASSRVTQESTKRSSGHQLQLFKLEVKVRDLLEKFDKNSLKFKKTVEVKQVHKFLETIRDLLPERGKVVGEMAKFQEEFEKLFKECESKVEKEKDEGNKRLRKQERKVKELEEALEQLRKVRSQEQSKARQQQKKLLKKLEQTQEKLKNTELRFQQIENTLRNTRKKLEVCDSTAKEDILRLEKKINQLEKECQSLSTEKTQLKLDLQAKNQSETGIKKESESEIGLYKKKIILLEEKNSQFLYEIAKKNQEFEALTIKMQQTLLQATKEKQQSQKALRELTQKFKICSQELEQKVQSLQAVTKEVQSLRKELQKAYRQRDITRQEVMDYQKVEQELQASITTLKAERDKYKKVGQLNETDIEQLKAEIEKVHLAYQETEDQLEQLRVLYEQLEERNCQLDRQNTHLKKKNQQLINQAQKLKSIEANARSFGEKFQQLEEQHQDLLSKYQHQEGELYLIRRENKQLKEEELQRSKELRELRQQLQSSKEEETLVKGKQKIELESAKVQLRRSREQHARIKEIYEEKLQLLEGKYKQLQKFISQKQLLAKISNSHCTQ